MWIDRCQESKALAGRVAAVELFVIAVTGLALLTDEFDSKSGGEIGAVPVGGSDSTATM